MFTAWIFLSLIFIVVYIKSFSTLMIILNIEYYSITIIFMVMFNMNNLTNGLNLSIILLILFSIESIYLLTFYVNLSRQNSKDYSLSFGV